MVSTNLNDISILSINGSDCCCIISWIRKKETINLMQNIDLTEKTELYKTWKFIITYKNV